MASPPVASSSALLVPGPTAFAAIYALDSGARALTATVIPLQAYSLYKEFATANADSYVGTTYSAVAMISFFGTFLTPFVIHRLGRNATYVIGILCCMIGMAGLATSTIPGLGLGMLGRALSGVVGSVCLILFIVDFIPRANLVWSETLRLFTEKWPCATICRPSRREAANPRRWTTLSSLSSKSLRRFSPVTPFSRSAQWKYFRNWPSSTP